MTEHRSFWRSPSGLALAGFLSIAAFFLLTEHRAHVLGVLPYALLLLCPAMHLLHHRGHGHGGQSNGRDEPSHEEHSRRAS